MRRKLVAAALGCALATTATMALEGDARACGGCFHPPAENPTIVTDHRMILTVSPDQSTLYDQIKYSGSPSAFAWVLPIAGTVDVGLSADIVFQALDQQTQTQIVAPPQNCPAPPDSCQQRNAGTAVVAPQGGGGVTVLSEQVVGPYETVQLASTDPQALATWLANNGFAIPADIQPVVAQYVAEHFNFLALKLIPGAGIQDMRPVRVTTKGAGATLPLRMVAAGTGATVGITLWVLAEGRYEPQNFPTFQITADELAWDWTQNKSNYTDLRAQKAAAGNGRAWEVESSTTLYEQNLQSVITTGYLGGGGPTRGADQDYLPVTDQNGTVTKTAAQVRDEDIATLFHGVMAATLRVTRLRSDVAHAALDADLVLSASADQSPLANVRQVTHEANQPLCPVYQGCNQVGTAPRDQAAAQTASNNSDKGETFACNTSSGSSSPLWIGAGLACGAFAVARARRNRRR